MEEINRLHDIADDIGSTSWGYELASAMHNIAAGIGEEVDRMRDLSGYEPDVLAWVEKNGGLDAVKEQRRESIPRAAYERKKAGWLDHIDECEEALARRNGRISELRRERDKLRDEAAWAESLSEILDEWADLLGFPEQKGDPGKITARVGAVLDGTWRRLMPEGMEWPMFEDGEPVRIGEHWGEDDFDTSVTRVDTIEFAADGVRLGNEYTEAFYRPGERVKRPAPPVLDADGVEIRVGDVVCQTYDFYGGSYTVTGFNDGIVTIKANAGNESDDTFEMPDQLTHRAPVLAADGKPLEVGQTVWDTNGDELVIGSIEDGGHTVTCRYADVGDGIPVHGMWSPSDLTHQRPVFDADGVPIKKGDTVWHKGTGEKYRVFRFSAIENRVWGENDLGSFLLNCSMLAHTKPEIDSWKRIEEYATLSPEVYCHRNGIDISQKDGTEFFLAGTVGPMARDLVRRCREVAERERGE